MGIKRTNATISPKSPSSKRIRRAKKRSSESVKKSQIKSVLSSMIEKKHAITEYADVIMKRTIPSGVVVNADGNFFKILPEIDQSVTGEAGRAYNTRIGNEITLKSIDMNGYLSYNYTNATNLNPQNQKLAVRVMILRAKDINDQELLFNNMPTDSLIRFGNQTAGTSNGPGSFGGYTLDPFRSINRDLFSVRYDEVHYLSAPAIAAGAAVGADVDVSLIPSKLKLFKHKLSFGENGIKLKYTSSTDLNPNNFPYFMVVGYGSMSSSTRPGDGLVRMSLSCVGTYTDA